MRKTEKTSLLTVAQLSTVLFVSKEDSTLYLCSILFLSWFTLFLLKIHWSIEKSHFKIMNYDFFQRIMFLPCILLLLFYGLVSINIIEMSPILIVLVSFHNDISCGNFFWCTLDTLHWIGISLCTVGSICLIFLMMMSISNIYAIELQNIASLDFLICSVLITRMQFPNKQMKLNKTDIRTIYWTFHFNTNEYTCSEVHKTSQ